MLERYILPRVWYVHRPVILMIHATPADCLEKLKTAAKPSVNRLHHRNLFQQGRRYYIKPRAGGFRLTTTHNLRWRYRKRTASTTVMWGDFSSLDDDITRIQLQVRINVGYLLDTFLIPAFITSILIYVPWPPVIIGIAIFVLFALSWSAHRFNAILEAVEMVWFVQKVLEEFVPAEIMELEPETATTVNYNRDFEAEWRRFYEERKQD